LNRWNESCVNWQTTPWACREDIDKKDQGWAFLDGGFAPPELNKDGPAIMVVVTPTAIEFDGTYKTLSKWAVLITTGTTLILYKSEDTSARQGCDVGPVNDSISIRGPGVRG
jgi:hypothetical protein